MRDKLVRRVRAVLRVKQAELATLLGCDSSTVSRWERGVSTPDDTAVAWLEVLEEFAGVAETDGQALLAHARDHGLPAAWHLALNYTMPGRNRFIEVRDHA